MEWPANRILRLPMGQICKRLNSGQHEPNAQNSTLTENAEVSEFHRQMDAVPGELD